jgi:hypothetical protein
MSIGCSLPASRKERIDSGRERLTVQVLLNDLANVPHRDGQKVLDVRHDDFAVEVRFSAGVYRVYGFVLLPGGGEYTRPAERSTVREARELALRAWREGRDFDTVIGSAPKKV